MLVALFVLQKLCRTLTAGGWVGGNHKKSEVNQSDHGKQNFSGFNLNPKRQWVGVLSTSTGINPNTGTQEPSRWAAAALQYRPNIFLLPGYPKFGWLGKRKKRS